MHQSENEKTSPKETLKSLKEILMRRIRISKTLIN